MRKIITLLMVIVMIIPMAITASAESTTELVTSVPDASYKLSIPGRTEVPFNAENTTLTMISVENASGFAVGKNLKVSVEYSDFRSETATTTIPFKLVLKTDRDTMPYKNWDSGTSIFFLGLAEGGLESLPKYYNESANPEMTLSGMSVKVQKEDWGKALAGEYKATLTFTAEVVAGH